MVEVISFGILKLDRFKTAMKNYLGILGTSLFILILGYGIGSWGTTYFLNSKENNKAIVIKPAPTPQSEVKDFVESDSNVVDLSSKSYNVLLTGKGGVGHSGGDLADSIILVHVDFDPPAGRKRAVLISIPRDFWFSGHKLNSDPSIKDAVATITGLSVQDYISIDFNSFISVIDKLGGIEIDIPKPYTDNFYPIKGLENEICGFSNEKIAELHANYSGFNLEKQFPCRYETIHFDTGKTNIDGATALKYVRSRHGDGDFGRSERQFYLLKSLLAKNISIQTIQGLMGLVKTNLSFSKVKSLATTFGNPFDYEIKTIHLSDANVLKASKSSVGAYILLPKAGEGNFSEIKEYISK